MVLRIEAGTEQLTFPKRALRRDVEHPAVASATERETRARGIERRRLDGAKQSWLEGDEAVGYGLMVGAIDEVAGAEIVRAGARPRPLEGAA